MSLQVFQGRHDQVYQGSSASDQTQDPRPLAQVRALATLWQELVFVGGLAAVTLSVTCMLARH